MSSQEEMYHIYFKINFFRNENLRDYKSSKSTSNLITKTISITPAAFSRMPVRREFYKFSVNRIGKKSDKKPPYSPCDPED